jgi:hypothetical protein
MTWGVPVARMEINGTLVGKPEGKSRLWKPRRRWIYTFECCILLRFIQLILYDTVNRNKVSIYINSLYFLFFTHYMFRPLRAILRWNILLIIFLFFKDYFNTTDPLHTCNSIIISRDVICRHRFFQPIVLIHVIILNIKNKRLL